MIEQVAKLNAHCFGLEDYYSDPNHIRYFLNYGKVKTLRDKGRIIAYALIREKRHRVDGVRFGVHHDYRGQGLGQKLVKRLIKEAGRKPYKTYTHIKNTTSATMHVRAGMRIRWIRDVWIYLEA